MAPLARPLRASQEAATLPRLINPGTAREFKELRTLRKPLQKKFCLLTDLVGVFMTFFQ
jgi:hypothetical protein